MKRLFVAVILCLSFAGSAAAATQTFGRVQVDVPAGWSAEVQGEIVLVAAPDGHAAATVVIIPNSFGRSPEATAQSLSQQLNGSAPKPENGAFVFEFENQGVVGKQYLISVASGEIMCISIAGDDVKLNGIVRSVAVISK
jgi:hypothetical protein